MKISVTGLRGPKIKALHDAGWRISYDNGQEAWDRRISGVEMQKEFENMGDAIREFERITGYDVISDTDQDGCAIWWFICREEKLAVGGWGCGKYLYKKWCKTPRKCLEALNRRAEYRFTCGLEL